MGYHLAIEQQPIIAWPFARGGAWRKGARGVTKRSPTAEVKSGLPPLLPRLWRYARVLCRDADFAHDLVQATCLRALERAGQFEPGTRLDHWTFTILNSIWKNEIEKRKVRHGSGLVDLDSVLSADDAEAIENGATVRKVISVIAAFCKAMASRPQ